MMRGYKEYIDCSGGGEGVFPCHRLMGMCRWIGSHFHGWIDCYYLSVMGCISNTVTDTVTIIGSRIFRISFFFEGGGEGEKILVSRDLKTRTLFVTSFIPALVFSRTT